MMTVTKRIASIVFIAAPLVSPTLAQEAGPALPGGASSLRETYGDWSVTCVATGDTRQCSLSREHRQQDGRRVLGLEIVPDAAGGLVGAIVLPFGLRLGAGVTLEIDESPVGQVLPFSTCLPAGCIVPLALDDAATQALRSGETLTLSATIDDSGETLSFSVPLAGFTSGLERTTALLH